MLVVGAAGVAEGTVVISEGAINGELRPFYTWVRHFRFLFLQIFLFGFSFSSPLPICPLFLLDPLPFIVQCSLFLGVREHQQTDN